MCLSNRRRSSLAICTQERENKRMKRCHKVYKMIIWTILSIEGYASHPQYGHWTLDYGVATMGDAESTLGLSQFLATHCFASRTATVRDACTRGPPCRPATTLNRAPLASPMALAPVRRRHSLLLTSFYTAPASASVQKAIVRFCTSA